MGEFRMPSLGADMDAGTVSEWLVKPGDVVHRGDIVAVVETEKSTIEVEIFENGVVDEILVEVGQRVPVGAVLATVKPAESRARPETATARARAVTASRPPRAAPAGGHAEPTRRGLAPSHAAAPAVGAKTQEKPVSRERLGGATAPAPVLSPVVRHLADHLGVELATVHGSGPGGVVTRSDVEKAAQHAEKRTQARVPCSPFARRIAGELGVDLAGLVGSGPGGSIVERDVRAAVTVERPGSIAEVPAPAGRVRTVAEAPSAADASVHSAGVAGEDRQGAMRRAIGELMARSKREIPHYYLSTTIDMSSSLAWLEEANQKRSIADRLIVPVLMLKATALAVRQVPEMNGFVTGESFTPSRSVHVGVAISLRTGGVIAPAIHDVDGLSLDELMSSLKDLVGRARRGVLRSSEMSDPTITVTNLGDLGVEAVFGVIYPPQVALVGFGKVSRRPFAVGELLGVRPCVTATLSADHRASDGHRGGLFLAEIDQLLQDPEKLQ